MIADDDLLNYIFAGFVGVLLIMILVNVLGASRNRRRTHRLHANSAVKRGGVSNRKSSPPTRIRRTGANYDASGGSDIGNEASSEGSSDSGGGDGGGGDGGGGD